MSDGVSRRLAGISESATLAITAKAKELRARGEAVIGFGAGEPDFATPAHVVEAAAAACADPRWHKYTLAAGLPDLRAAVAEKTRRGSGFDAAPDNVLITNGAKGAVYATCAALLDPGDEVLMPAPYWVTYPEAIGLAGGVMVPVPTTIETGFRATVDQLEAARTERTKLLIFVSPSNPTGAVYPPEQVAEIGRWAAEHGIWVMTDEIYEHLVYGDMPFASIASDPAAAERTVIVNGVSKSYAMTGWRVGWMVGPLPVIKAATRLQSHAASNVANAAEIAALAALTGTQEPLAEMQAAFAARRDLMHSMLGEIPGVNAIEPDGAFYAFPDVGDMLGRDLRGRSAATDMELAALLLEEIKIAVVPGEAFGAPGYVRLSFALGDEDLRTGLERWKDYASA